jgi:hypothetical protein
MGETEMAVAVFQRAGQAPIQRAMKVPRRPEQLEKWFKEASRALGSHWPDGLTLANVSRFYVDVDRIEWVWFSGDGNREMRLMVDREASALGC